MDRWIFYACVFAAGFLLTAVLTPLFRKIAWKTGFLDVPKAEQHKLHGKATPLLGRAAMFSGWILCVIGGTAVFMLSGRELMPQALHELLVICICAAAAVFLGM